MNENIGFNKINNHKEFWDFLELRLGSYLFDPTTYLRNRYVMVGPLRIRQARILKRDCLDEVKKFFPNNTCYNTFMFGNNGKSCNEERQGKFHEWIL